MADMTFGSTFQPGSQSGGGQQPWMRAGGSPGASGGGFSPVQQAVKILSLRLPQVFGQQAPVASQLMSSTHGGLTQPSAVARSVIANVTGGGQQPPIAPPAPITAPGALPSPTAPMAPPRQQQPAPPQTYRGYQIPNLPSSNEASNLGNVLAQIPHNLPPNISMIRPGGGGFATQIGQSAPAFGGLQQGLQQLASYFR